MAYAFTQEQGTPSAGRTTLTWSGDVTTAKAVAIIGDAMKNYQRKGAPFAIRGGDGELIAPESLTNGQLAQMAEDWLPYILRAEADDYERTVNIDAARETALSDHDLGV